MRQLVFDMQTEQKKGGAARAVNGITDGVIWRQLLKYFFPILLGTFFQQLYNTVDAIVVGQYLGKTALAAVGGTTGTLINLVVGFFMGLSSGGTVIVSQYYGRGEADGVSRAVHTAIALSLCGGALLTVCGLAFSRAALQATGTPADVIDGAATYMRIYFSGVIFNLLYNIGAGVLRAVGDSRRPMLFLIVCCLINIVLDLLLVRVLNMGIAGVALATILSQTISAALVMRALMHTDDSYRFTPRKLRLDMGLLRRILVIGCPAGLQSMMYSISNTLIQANVNALGTDTMAGWTAFGKVDNIYWMVINAFGISIMTFVGQNYGAGKRERVIRSIKVCFAIAACTSVAISCVVMLLGRPFIGLFTGDETVLQISLTAMRAYVPFYITYVTIEILSGAMRGMGNSLGPMLIISCGICGLRITWIYTVVAQWSNITAIALGYPVSWLVTSICMALYFAHWSRRNGLRSYRLAGD